MKNFKVNYMLINDKTTKKFVIVSDLHNYFGDKKGRLAESIKEEEADLIIVAGDNLQGSKYRKERPVDNFEYFLSDISEESPVVITKGNHDLVGYTRKSRREYKALEEARPGMVFPLENEVLPFDDMRVVDFTPSREAFAPSGQESGLALRTFLEDWYTKGKVPPKDGKFNILLCHNPKIAAQARSIAEQNELAITPEEKNNLAAISDILGRYDMIASGHLHNGYLRAKKVEKNPKKYLDQGYWEMPVVKKANGHIASIRPLVMQKTDMCRGVVYVGQGPERIIQLQNNEYYFLANRYEQAIAIEPYKANVIIQNHHLTPIVISGGINKFFGLPIDQSEVTVVRSYKR